MRGGRGMAAAAKRSKHINGFLSGSVAMTLPFVPVQVEGVQFV